MITQSIPNSNGWNIYAPWHGEMRIVATFDEYDAWTNLQDALAFVREEG